MIANATRIHEKLRYAQTGSVAQRSRVGLSLCRAAVAPQQSAEPLLAAHFSQWHDLVGNVAVLGFRPTASSA
jgi:hypothetical protein